MTIFLLFLPSSCSSGSSPSLTEDFRDIGDVCAETETVLESSESDLESLILVGPTVDAESVAGGGEAGSKEKGEGGGRVVSGSDTPWRRGRDLSRIQSGRTRRDRGCSASADRLQGPIDAARTRWETASLAKTWAPRSASDWEMAQGCHCNVWNGFRRAWCVSEVKSREIRHPNILRTDYLERLAIIERIVLHIDKSDIEDRVRVAELKSSSRSSRWGRGLLTCMIPGRAGVRP
ncbi:hypothetical protein DFH09DRAFT_346961 [Mycena vulgaris]|nr:hypothetical protein DFH09DRAFT_346961 [Mycena vulgaris]